MGQQVGSLAVFVAGRSFRGHHRVRLGDVDTAARARLDALARYLQDIANDDAYDSGIDNPGVWVVRRNIIEVHRWPELREDLELVTFCAGLGACWAERRTTITGHGGALVEASALWVQLDPGGTRPARLGPSFLAAYGESAAGRRVSAGLVLGDAPAGAPSAMFALRHSDLDVMGHVNNAVYWAMVEQALAQRPFPSGPTRFELEHHQPIDATTLATAVVELTYRPDGMVVTAAGVTAAVAAWRDRDSSVEWQLS